MFSVLVFYLFLYFLFSFLFSFSHCPTCLFFFPLLLASSYPCLGSSQCCFFSSISCILAYLPGQLVCLGVCHWCLLVLPFLCRMEDGLSFTSVVSSLHSSCYLWIITLPSLSQVFFSCFFLFCFLCFSCPVMPPHTPLWRSLSTRVPAVWRCEARCCWEPSGTASPVRTAILCLARFMKSSAASCFALPITLSAFITFFSTPSVCFPLQAVHCFQRHFAAVAVPSLQVLFLLQHSVTATWHHLSVAAWLLLFLCQPRFFHQLMLIERFGVKFSFLLIMVTSTLFF